MVSKSLADPRKTKVLYFLGKFMFNMFTGMEMYYFAAYLTDAALLPAALAGLALNVPTVVDLILSFFNGAIIEKLPHPIGKYRFWLYVGPVIAAIFYVICYIRIESDFACAVMITVALIIAHLFWSLAENVFNSLPAILTDDMAERASLSMLHGAATNWSGFLFGLIAMPIILFFNGALASSTHGYAVMTAIVGVLYIVSFVVLANSIKAAEAAEAARQGNETAAKAKGPSLGAMLANVLKNPPMLVLMLYSLFFWTTSFLNNALMFYYFNCTLGALALMSIGMSCTSIGKMISGFIYGPLLKLCKGSKRNLTILTNAVCAVHLLIMWVIQPGPWVFIITNSIASIFRGIISMPLIAMYGDCANYGEWKTGVESKSFVMSMYGIPLKVGLMLKGFILSAVIALVGYTATVDPTVYAGTFNNAYCLLMAVLTIASCIVLLAGYHLTEEKVTQLTAETEKRKAGK